jgi:hypothetical protein
MIWELHYSRVEGNFGIENTMEVLQQRFYWKKFREDVSKYIKSFTSYTISKLDMNKQGKYTPRGNDYVILVADCFSKMVIIFAYKKSIIAGATPRIFFERVWVCFGIPKSII